MHYRLTYVDRRIVTRTEEVRVSAKTPEEAIQEGNRLMERYGYRLKQYKKPQVRPI